MPASISFLRSGFPLFLPSYTVSPAQRIPAVRKTKKKNSSSWPRFPVRSKILAMASPQPKETSRTSRSGRECASFRSASFPESSSTGSATNTRQIPRICHGPGRSPRNRPSASGTRSPSLEKAEVSTAPFFRMFVCSSTRLTTKKTPSVIPTSTVSRSISPGAGNPPGSMKNASAMQVI